jgi:hypothetical protein
VPLLLEQPESVHADELMESDDQMAVWWATIVECGSAFARLRREGVITPEEEEAASESLEQLRAHWQELSPTDEIRTHARRLVRIHRLRAADALQLAAAVVWSAHVDAREFVSFDTLLREAARLEGLAIV